MITLQSKELSRVFSNTTVLKHQFFGIAFVYESESEVSPSCPTLCDPMDCSLPGSSVRGIFQARILKWVVISFSRKLSQPRDQTHASCIRRQILYIEPPRQLGRLLLLLLLLSRFSRVRLCATPETAAHQAPPSLGFSGQQHWSGLPFPSPMHDIEK